MAHALGYHLVFSGYGLWLPGDERGHWSTAWDDEMGYIEPHMLHEGDPIRLRMAQERQKHPRVYLNAAMIQAVVDAICDCANESDWAIVAGSVEATHTHLLLTYTQRDIDIAAKWLKDRTTKEIHKSTSHKGPVWCKGRWRGFIFDPLMWDNSKAYIERHNERRGEGPRPYPFIRI